MNTAVGGTIIRCGDIGWAATRHPHHVTLPHKDKLPSIVWRFATFISSTRLTMRLCVDEPALRRLDASRVTRIERVRERGFKKLRYVGVEAEPEKPSLPAKVSAFCD
jgi:hypothetical protein